MLPTRVGMNRSAVMDWKVISYAPHSRGDEPASPNTFALLSACSPLAWG